LIFIDVLAAKKKPELNPALYLFFNTKFYILRNRVFKRLIVRAALFLWIKPLFAILSISGAASLKAAEAFSLSPAVMAFKVSLIKVRIRERKPALCALRFTAWRARLIDCGELAKAFS
jgi:hypothetical protein